MGLFFLRKYHFVFKFPFIALVPVVFTVDRPKTTGLSGASISGLNFGPGGSYSVQVSVNSVVVTSSWVSDSQILCDLPIGAGSLAVVVTINSQASNSFSVNYQGFVLTEKALFNISRSYY